MTGWIDFRSRQQTSYTRTGIRPLPSIATVVLSDGEKAALRALATRCPHNPYIPSQEEPFIAAATRVDNGALSHRIVTTIRDQLDSGYGCILVTNLPTDDELPTTPARGGALAPDYKNTFVAEFCLMAVGSATSAEPFNFHQEGMGSAPLIDNVVPVPELRSQRGAGGYENNFPFHCESTFHRLRPDYLVLFGVRGDDNAKTIVFSVQDFDRREWPLNDMPHPGWFRVRAPDLYVQMEAAGIPLGTPMYSLVPPLQERDGQIVLNINFNGTECRDEDCLQWLARLERYVEDWATGVVLEPGTALVLNNERTCHTRTGYNPSFAGDDRWFIRGNFKRDLWERQSHNASTLAALGPETIDKLVRVGWLNHSGDLLPAFEQLIRNPHHVKELPPDRAALVAIAFQFTPLRGTRIV